MISRKGYVSTVISSIIRRRTLIGAVDRIRVSGVVRYGGVVGRVISRRLGVSSRSISHAKTRKTPTPTQSPTKSRNKEMSNVLLASS